MKSTGQCEYDVIVIGGGISGLGAAFRLQEAGLNVIVLEKNATCGGRMSTDHINGFAIDRGVSIFGSGFKRMKALVKKLGLEDRAEKMEFVFGLQDKQTCSTIRRARLDDVLFSNKINWKNKFATIRFGTDVLLKSRNLAHGKSTTALNLDDVSVKDHFRNIGGADLLEEIFVPGLNGPMGGNLRNNSRLILYQTFWNILLNKTWAMKGGMDTLINAIVNRLNVRTKCDVVAVAAHANAADCDVTLDDGTVLTARSVILALPGNIASKLCPELPTHVHTLLRATKFGHMVNAHVMLDRVTDNKCPGYGISKELGEGYEIELEHNRVSELCPEGKGLASVYMWNEGASIVTGKSDEEIRLRAEQIVRDRFPECRDSILGTHIVRWEQGIAHFPPGRLTQMRTLREEMKTWKLPVQLCGDYLDGIASESALVTGEEAAENVLCRQGR